MQLYDINSFKTWEVPQWAKNIIKEKYPSFEKKGMKIQCTPERIKTVQMVRFNHFDDEPFKKIQEPNPNSRKAKGTYVYDDNVYNLQLSSQPPKVNRHGQMQFMYPANNYELSVGKKVQKGDWATMFYLEFLCPMIKGNSCQNPSPSPYWQFELKQEEAAAEISKAKKERDLKNLIYFDAPDEKIVACYTGLNLKRNETIDEDRVQLFRKLSTGSQLLKDNALAILKAEKATKDEKVVAAEESVSELVNRLLQSETIKFEDFGWYRKDKRGEGNKWLGKPFHEDKADPETAFFNLVELLKVNNKMFEDLKK